MKITIPKIQKKKQTDEKIVAITCYDFTFAKLINAAEVDLVLVGDSLGMVIQGQKSTLPVSIREMIYHTAAVARGLTKPLLVADMPFMSYQSSLREALQNAGRLMKDGKAESVKIEGGVEVAEMVYRMDRIGVPVMGHIGLQPQSIHKYGGYKIRGKTVVEEKTLLEDAKALEEAGAWGIVLEGIPMEVSQKITSRLEIPTIGIGSGPDCDGQILVLYDLLGLDPEFQPRFLKKYANLSEIISSALRQYSDEVKGKKFPDEQHSFQLKSEVIHAADQFRQRRTRDR